MDSQSFHMRAVTAFKDNLKAKGIKMNNQPDDMRTFETDEASQVKRPTDDELADYIDCQLSWDMSDFAIISEYDEKTLVQIVVEIPWGDIER